MKSILKIFSDKKGNILVISAFLLIVLAGFAGLSLDLALVLYNRQILQDGADMAALAAVQEIGHNHGAIQSTAVQYIHKNGISGGHVSTTWPYNGDELKLRVEIDKNMPLVFMPFFGIENVKINVHATAGVVLEPITGYTDKAMNYAVFHGRHDNTLDVRGAKTNIKGNVHGNQKIQFNGSQHTINGNVTANKEIYLNGTTVSGTVQQYTPLLPMPIFNFDEYAAKATKVFNSDTTLQNMAIDGVWLVNGNCDIIGSKVTGKGVLLVTGEVHISGSGIEYTSEEDLLAIYGKKNIHITASNCKIQGVLYAPNGHIRLDGARNTIYGALIGKEVEWATSQVTIDALYDARAPVAFTTYKETYRLYE